MIERVIIMAGIIFGTFSFRTLFKKQPGKLWLSFYILNCTLNYLFDRALVEKGKVRYPVRFLPNVFKINFVYDFLVCPFLSVWYSQSTYNSNLKGVIGKLIIFATPQAVYEIILERKTKTLEFKKNWNWIRSAYLIFIVKILSRMLFKFLKKQLN